MYYVDAYPDGILLTPDPSFAKHDKNTIPAFTLQPGKYFNPDSLTMDLSPSVIQMLKKKDYLGVILGDYLEVFSPDALKLIGEYDYTKHS